jgi:DNA-binding CsgD family transcriptional regulator
VATAQGEKRMSDEMVNVSIETWGGGVDSVDGDLLDDLIDSLIDLGASGPSVGGGGLAGGPSGTFSVPTGHAATEVARVGSTIRRAVEIFEEACVRVGLRHRGIARVDLMDDRYLDLWLNQEPETYLGVSEVAELLGVSKQRVSELRRTHPEFPEPVADQAAGPVWAKSSLGLFLDEWPRRAGRPASWETRLHDMRPAIAALVDRDNTLLGKANLSERDRRVLRSIAAGESTRDIAEDLGVSTEAARSAIRRAMGRLQSIIPDNESLDESMTST